MLDGLKRSLAGSAITSLLKSLATSKDTQTSITGIVAAGVLAYKGLDMAALIAGDPVQIAHVVSCVLVALIGVLASKENVDGQTTFLGAVAGALYAAQGDVDNVTTGVVIAVLGHFTSKVAPARGRTEG